MKYSEISEIKTILLLLLSVLQIRWSNKDNIEIIMHISS